MVSKTFDNKKIIGRGPNPNLKCAKCNRLGHTIERCYEIVGYPPGWVKRSNNFVNKPVVNHNVVSNSGSSQLPFSTEQITKLMSLINDNSVGGSACSNMAGTFVNFNTFFNSNFDKFFNSNATKTSPNVNLGWIIDSGATQHMTGSSKGLLNTVDVSDLNMTVSHPNGTLAKIDKIGNLRLSNNITLFGVLIVPEYCVSLLSVHKLSKDSKLFVGFDESNCYIQDLSIMKNVGTGKECAGLYLFDSGQGIKVNLSDYLSHNVWHNKLGHPANQVLKVLKNKVCSGIEPVNIFCEVCHRAKQTREPFPLSEHKSSVLGDLVHLDLWGPYKITSKEGFKYFLTIVDGYTRAVWVYLLKSKDEVFDVFQSFVNIVHTQFGKCVKIIRNDNGTEFVNNKMDLLCNSKGILHQTTCVYTPQQNGIVERKHRHLLNVARSLLFQSGVPLNMWSDCILTATYIINRLPSSVLSGKFPFEMIFGCEPKLSHLRVFGCLCFATILNETDKFSSRSEKCIFVGYSNSKKGYKLFSLDRKTILFSRDVKFYEKVFPFKSNIAANDSESDTHDLNHINFFDSVYKKPNTSQSLQWSRLLKWFF